MLTLFLALVAVVRSWQSGERFATNQLRRERESAELAGEALGLLRSEYCALAEAVSMSLESIRQDIDPNYHHTHDGHVLDAIASRLRREVKEHRVYEIRLDAHSAQEVETLGGKVSDQRTMGLGQMLAFGWHLHTRARERADTLTHVVQQPCGNHGHAAWLGKTLAIYELMCDSDKTLAIKRLSAVIEVWRHEPAQFAPRYVEEIH